MKTQLQIGNYIAEQVVNQNPYLFDADGDKKVIGKKIWMIKHKTRNDIFYSKTKKWAKERMFYLAMKQP
jgi:hypothetical protein